MTGSEQEAFGPDFLLLWAFLERGENDSVSQTRTRHNEVDPPPKKNLRNEASAETRKHVFLLPAPTSCEDPRQDGETTKGSARARAGGLGLEGQGWGARAGGQGWGPGLGLG